MAGVTGFACRIQLEQFHFPGRQDSACQADSFTISSGQSGNYSSVDSFQEICGHKDGLEGNDMLQGCTSVQSCPVCSVPQLVLYKSNIFHFIPVLLPVLSASTVLLTAKLSPDSQAVWRVKTSQEMCGKRVSRSLDLAWQGAGAAVQGGRRAGGK